MFLINVNVLNHCQLKCIHNDPPVYLQVGSIRIYDSDSPRVLLERRLRWLVDVLCGSRVFCWWLLSMGLVAMMLSLYLFIRANLVLSLTADK